MQQARQYQRRYQANAHAKQREPQPFANDDAEYILRLRAKRHTDANFTGSLRHGIRHHTVNADRREHQSEHRQDSDEPGTKTRLRHRGGHVFFHGANLHERLIGIDLGECAAQCRRLKRGIACCAQYHRKLEHRQKQIRLAIGQVHFGLRVSAQAEVNITDYADDFHGRHFLFGQRA